jgi:hypothetical protein
MRGAPKCDNSTSSRAANATAGAPPLANVTSSVIIASRAANAAVGRSWAGLMAAAAGAALVALGLGRL